MPHLAVCTSNVGTLPGAQGWLAEKPWVPGMRMSYPTATQVRWGSTYARSQNRLASTEDTLNSSPQAVRLAAPRESARIVEEGHPGSRS